MIGQNAEQPTLFEITELAGSARPPGACPEMASRSSWPDNRDSPAGESRSKEVGPLWAVSPFANLPLHEACAFCGAEVRPPGFVILDFEDLGVFCNEGCADKGFSLYLNDAADEEGELDSVE